MLIENLQKRRLISPPPWLASNCHYLTIMGSEAYGCATDLSDKDIYGFCIPPKDMVFPVGIIFVPHGNGQWRPLHGQKIESFAQWQQHGIEDKDAGKTYDFQVFSIIRYFDLLIECNPNLIDSAFTSAECVIHQTKVATMVRENRTMFLHRGAWHRFKAYAISQLHKMNSKNPIGKRVAIREAHGFDSKFAYHLVRLLDEIEQIITTGDINLRRNNEQLKAIRRGEVPEEDIRRWAAEKELSLEKQYAESKLPEHPPMEKIKALLYSCLEEHYGSLQGLVEDPNAPVNALREIQAVIDRHKAAIWS